MTLRPKSLLYRDALAAAEQRIVDALPGIVDVLIARARDGNTKVATYLLDRIYGKVAGSTVPPAHDRSEPFTEDDYERGRQEREETKDLEREERKSDRVMRRLFAGFGAGDGA